MSKPNDVVNIMATSFHTGSAKILMNDIRSWRTNINEWTGSVGSPLQVNFVHVAADFPYSGSVLSKNHKAPSHLFQVQLGDGINKKIAFVKTNYSPFEQGSTIRNTISESLKSTRGVTAGHQSADEPPPTQ